MKCKLGEKIMKEIVALRPKMYCFFTDDDYTDKKANGTKKYVIKQQENFKTTKVPRE